MSIFSPQRLFFREGKASSVQKKNKMMMGLGRGRHVNSRDDENEDGFVDLGDASMQEQDAMVVQTQPPPTSGWSMRLGYAVVKMVSYLIGWNRN